MEGRAANAGTGGVGFAKVTVGDAAQCEQRLSAAIARRAEEIARHRGASAGDAAEDRRLAEKDIVRPFCGGILESKEGFTVSLCRSSFAPEEIEVCAEPRRLIVIEMKKTPAEASERPTVFRVLPLHRDCDPSSLAIHRRGSIFELELHNPPVSKEQRYAARGKP